MDERKDKVVVITGGNSGIGEAIAKKFDQEGAKVVIFGRDQKKLDQVNKHLKKGLTIQGDVRNLPDLERLFQMTQNSFGPIDVLVANAGIAERRKVDDVDEKFFDEMVGINYKGLYFTVQRSIPSLNKGASVILISSAAAHKGWHNHSVYSSTKAAVSMLARNFAADLVDRGIRVNAVSPGFTDTPLFDTWKETQPSIINDLEKKVPVKRFASPAEIAEAVYFLSSPQAAYIVGVDLVVDGGASSILPE
jgi:NAD(P)-dependent dehydrogenase (short-subunit alcohol dehydrogenase family)